MKISKKNLFYILSFLISSVLMILIFLFNRMNGKDYLVIRSDFVDSIGFYKYFAEVILQHKSLFFNYTSGLGLNNIMSVSGLFSPFNILYLIFYRVNFDIITAVIIILKVGFSAVSFQIFSNHTLKNKDFSSVIISVFYALNAYAIEFGTIQIAWLEALIILPLLCASIVECIENNRRVNVIILYAYIFLTQFYMGYIIGIFSLLFVLLYLFILYQYKTEHKFKECMAKFMNWSLGVLVAIMLSACIWVPTLFFLAANRVPDSSSIVELNASLFQILNSLFWGMDYGIKGTYSYIYCGIPVLVLFPLFFLNRKIDSKKKWFYGILMSILLVSMVSNRLNTIWHVFDQPDDFWYRYSFLLCFCLCTIASIEISDFDIREGKKLLYVLLGLSFFYQLMYFTRDLWQVDYGVQNTNFGFITNLVLIILWASILFFAYCKNKFRVICLILAMVVMGFEIIFGSKRQITNRTEASAYNTWMDSVGEVVNEIRGTDKEFYRTIIASNNLTYNSDTYFGLNGIGDFGNQEKYGVRKFLSNIGFATSPRITFENGYNPVAEMILGVKYEIFAPEINYREEADELSDILEDYQDDKNPEEKNSVTKQDITTYSDNPYALGLGYLVNGDVLLYEYSGRNVFANMNEMVSAMSGIDEPCFVSYPADKAEYDSENIELAELDNGKYLFLRNDSEGKLQILVPKDNYNKSFLQFEKEETYVLWEDYFVLDAQNAPSGAAIRMALSDAIEMRKTEDDKYFVTTIGSYDGFSPEGFECDGINIAYLDENVLEKQYNELSKNQLQITKMDNGYIEGTIHVEGNRRMLFTTIPYDPGWKAYINGQEVETIRVIDGTFMAIYLPAEGDYNITFDFECPGLRIGVIVSVCGILAFLSVVFEKKLKKNKVNQNKKDNGEKK